MPGLHRPWGSVRRERRTAATKKLASVTVRRKTYHRPSGLREPEQIAVRRRPSDHLSLLACRAFNCAFNSCIHFGQPPSIRQQNSLNHGDRRTDTSEKLPTLKLTFRQVCRKYCDKQRAPLVT